MVSKIDSSGTTSYFYDYENRLVQLVTPNSQFVTYKYDPFGRRIEKSIADTVTGTVTTMRYVYDREDVLFELDGSGNIVTEFVHGPGIDELIAMIRNNQTYYYHADALGSIIAITNSAGQVVQRYEYNSFGQITYTQDATFKQPYTFTGREYDEESGLYYYRARYYDAKVGRFISEDPIGFRGGINLYSYVGNSPINFIDPFGLAIYPPPGVVPEGYVKCKKRFKKEREKCIEDFNDCLNDCSRIPNACDNNKGAQALVGMCELSCHGNFIACITLTELGSIYCELENPLIPKPKPPVMRGN